MTEFEQLTVAAYKTERVLSRRLARHAGLTEAAALALTLEQSAGTDGLPHLLAVRALARQVIAERRAARLTIQAGSLAQKKNKHIPAPGAWLAWFDGSAHPNPGKIGIGGLIAGPGGEKIEISHGAGLGNSSEAEYLALIAVLEAGVRLQPARFIVYGDSQVVIDDVHGKMKTGAKGLHLQRARATELIAQMAQVELRWIPRHKNAAADRLSQRAVAEWHGGDPG